MSYFSYHHKKYPKYLHYLLEDGLLPLSDKIDYFINNNPANDDYESIEIIDNIINSVNIDIYRKLNIRKLISSYSLFYHSKKIYPRRIIIVVNDDIETIFIIDKKHKLYYFERKSLNLNTEPIELKLFNKMKFIDIRYNDDDVYLLSKSGKIYQLLYDEKYYIENLSDKFSSDKITKMFKNTENDLFFLSNKKIYYFENDELKQENIDDDFYKILKKNKYVNYVNFSNFGSFIEIEKMKKIKNDKEIKDYSDTTCDLYPTLTLYKDNKLVQKDYWDADRTYDLTNYGKVKILDEYYLLTSKQHDDKIDKFEVPEFESEEFVNYFSIMSDIIMYYDNKVIDIDEIHVCENDFLDTKSRIMSFKKWINEINYDTLIIDNSLMQYGDTDDNNIGLRMNGRDLIFRKVQWTFGEFLCAVKGMLSLEGKGSYDYIRKKGMELVIYL